MSTTYPKIPGPFWRDPATNQITEKWSTPELEVTAGLQWRFTEKVDGTNVRIIWDGHRVSFGGRTDNAQFHPDLFRWLEEHFGGPDNEVLFEQKFGESTAVLYGEGYGAGIQSGGKYLPYKSVVLFDVLVDGLWWLQREGVEDVATYFGMAVVPVRFVGTLREAVDAMRIPLHSEWGDFIAEGMVGVTEAGLRGRNGERLIVKLKTRDLTLKAA
jgi:hypothetical protein